MSQLTLFSPGFFFFHLLFFADSLQVSPKVSSLCVCPLNAQASQVLVQHLSISQPVPPSYLMTLCSPTSQNSYLDCLLGMTALLPRASVVSDSLQPYGV